MDRRVIALITFAAGLLIVVGVILIGRSGDDSDGGGGASTAEPKEAPKVEVPDGPPPSELVIEDLEPGDGAEAKSGDQLSVDYVGVDYETKEEFDSSFNTGAPFEFQLGAGSVIDGWDQGLEGMKVGGRRQLIVPPDLAYGAAGQPPTIAPNATLVFVIDLLSVQ